MRILTMAAALMIALPVTAHADFIYSYETDIHNPIIDPISGLGGYIDFEMTTDTRLRANSTYHLVNNATLKRSDVAVSHAEAWVFGKNVEITLGPMSLSHENDAFPLSQFTYTCPGQAVCNFTLPSFGAVIRTGDRGVIEQWQFILYGPYDNIFGEFIGGNPLIWSRYVPNMIAPQGDVVDLALGDLKLMSNSQTGPVGTWERERVAVPEPASMALLMMGLLGLAATRLLNA